MKKIYILYVLLFFTLNALRAQILDTIIDAGGYNLHFKIIKGDGTPIIFESGAGDDSSIWANILDSVSLKTGTTLITYDRSGFGKSSTLKEDMNILDEIIGLEKGLHQLRYNKKYMLVGHSYGGFCSGLFATRNPDKVIGYVAIDANLPCMFNEGRIKIVNDMFELKKDSLRNSNIGLYNLAISFEEDVKIIEKYPFPINIPVIDVVAENQYMDSVLTFDCHKKFVSLSEKRLLIVAKKCGHYIFKDDPLLIINNISDMYKRTDENVK